ncbi:hypothetical protein J0910_19660 [Nocardiopsis sp. CNT-189]|uniref:hypothetical protein n=1 Tax=Nocardiopsis oceanisediminis TaxID=2816862 RepID=UPI003B357772
MGLLSEFFSEMLSRAMTRKADAVVMSAQSRRVQRFAAEGGLHHTPPGRPVGHAAPALGELCALGVPAAPEQACDVVGGTLRGIPVLGFDNPHVKLHALDGGHFWFAAARLPYACPDVIARSPWEVRHAKGTPVTGWFPNLPHYVPLPGASSGERGVLTADPGFAAHAVGAVRGRGRSYRMSWAVRGHWAVTWDPGPVTLERLRQRFGLVCDLAARCR